MYDQLFPHLSTQCVIDQVIASERVLRVEVHPRQPSAVCPSCGQPSPRVHSHYRRSLGDLPCSGRPLQVQVVVRRLRCSTPGCPRTTFAEPLPGLTQRYARRTTPNARREKGWVWPWADDQPPSRPRGWGWRSPARRPCCACCSGGLCPPRRLSVCWASMIGPGVGDDATAPSSSICSAIDRWSC